VTSHSRKMQRSLSLHSLFRIHIRTIGDKQFGDFLVIFQSRKMQRSLSKHTSRIHIRTSSQVLFYCFNIAFFARLTECSLEDVFDE